METDLCVLINNESPHEVLKFDHHIPNNYQLCDIQNWFPVLGTLEGIFQPEFFIEISLNLNYEIFLNAIVILDSDKMTCGRFCNSYAYNLTVIDV